jgi:hypothetical protein
MESDTTKIKEKMENAFKPFRCVAEVWDYGDKLRFKVFDENDDGIIECKSIVTRLLKDKAFLESTIEQARERVKAKGFALSDS